MVRIISVSSRHNGSPIVGHTIKFYRGGKGLDDSETDESVDGTPRGKKHKPKKSKKSHKAGKSPYDYFKWSGK